MKQVFEGTAVVTGASSGIGRAVALRLGKLGSHVCLTARHLEGLSETASTILRQGGSAEAQVLDLNHPGSLRGLLESLDNEPSPLTVLVNAAGAYYPGNVTDLTPERSAEMFRVNVLSLLEGCQAAVEIMRDHRLPGHIVNISALTARNDVGGVYGATKAAVESLGRSLRRELEDDAIRICTLIAGVTKTQLGRALNAEQIQERVAAATARGHADDGDRSPVMAEPEAVADAVEYVLRQPIELNVHELTLRPARDMMF